MAFYCVVFTYNKYNKKRNRENKQLQLQWKNWRKIVEFFLLRKIRKVVRFKWMFFFVVHFCNRCLMLRCIFYGLNYLWDFCFLIFLKYLDVYIVSQIYIEKWKLNSIWFKNHHHLPFINIILQNKERKEIFHPHYPTII